MIGGVPSPSSRNRLTAAIGNSCAKSSPRDLKCQQEDVKLFVPSDSIDQKIKVLDCAKMRSKQRPVRQQAFVTTTSDQLKVDFSFRDEMQIFNCNSLNNLNDSCGGADYKNELSKLLRSKSNNLRSNRVTQSTDHLIQKFNP